MQASNLSASEKALGAGVALLSAFGAYQGVDASNQSERNRVRIESLRIEQEEHRTAREQLAKLVAVDLRSDTNLWQAAAQYELAVLTLGRLPKRDHEAYSKVLENIMESLSAELDRKLATYEESLAMPKVDRAKVVADLERVNGLSLRIRAARESLRKTAASAGIRLAPFDRTIYWRVVLFVCDQKGKEGMGVEANARDKLRRIQSQYFPNNVAVWDAKVASGNVFEELSSLAYGQYVIADRSEKSFADRLAIVLNENKFSLGAAAASATWKVVDQPGSRTTPLYTSMYYCPAPNQKGVPANPIKRSGT